MDEISSLVLEPAAFRVKVLSTLITPSALPMEGVMIFCEYTGGIIFSFEKKQMIFPFGSFAELPWSPPLGNIIRFGLVGSVDSDLLIEFQSRKDLLGVHTLLRAKYLDDAQFMAPGLLCRSSVLKNINAEKSIIWKKPEKKLMIQNNAIINKDVLYEIKRSCLWEPTKKRFRQSLNMEVDDEENLETGDLSAMLSKLSVNEFAVQQEINFGDSSSSASLIPESSGFMNLGNTCYMNSMLQGLFANWIFVKELYKFCMEMEEYGLDLAEEIPLSSAIASLAKRRCEPINGVKIKLLKIIKETADFSNGQQDAHEFLINILNQMQEECDKILRSEYAIEDKHERDIQNPITSNFAFVMESIITCERCGIVARNEEESIILPVSIHILEQAGQRCLIIFIKRYSFNALVAIKRDDKVEIPLYLTLNKGSVEQATSFPALSPAAKKIDLKTVRPLGRRILSNVKRRLTLGSASSRSISSVIDAQSITLSAELKNLTISGLPEDGAELGENRIEQIGEDIDFTDLCKPADENNAVNRRELAKSLGTCHTKIATEFSKFGKGGYIAGDVEQYFRAKSVITREMTRSAPAQRRKRLMRSGSLQTIPRHRGPRISLGHYSDDDMQSTQIKKWSLGGRKRRLSESSGCDQRNDATISKVSLLRIKKELDTEMVRSTVSWQSAMNNNMENIPPESLNEAKQTKYLEEAGSSTSAEKKMFITCKKLNCEIPIIPFGHLQINDENFITEQFIHPRNTSAANPTDSDVGDMDSDEIVDASGLQPIPYKPLSEGNRNEICAQIGLSPRENWMIESSVCWMSMYDQPDFLVLVPGNDNRLFHTLAHYLTGDSSNYHLIRQAVIQFEFEHANEFMNLKNWDTIEWNAHLNNLFLNAGNDSDVELFAFASMFKVDIWVFQSGRWVCYRPKFLAVNDQGEGLDIEQYHTGENEGVYLNYENGLYLPVFKPSDKWLSAKRFRNMVLDNDGNTTQPSYRLISFVSHIGETVDSGHYVCDVWCNESKRWFLCDDESIEPVDELSLQKQSTTGYIYFYLNR
uniref:USP domain-containing protein n=1 Tax=Setaria digitata TaxID=48799 RepID=A0A915PHX4_9BILA